MKKSILLGLFAFGRKIVGMYKYSHAAISDPRLRDRKLVDEPFSCLITEPVYMRLGGRPLSFAAAISLRLFVFSSNSLPLLPPHPLLTSSSPTLMVSSTTSPDVSCISSLCRYHFAPSSPSLSCAIGCSSTLCSRRTFSPSFVCHLFSLPLSFIIFPPLSSVHFHPGAIPQFLLVSDVSVCAAALTFPRRRLHVTPAVTPCPACTSCLNSRSTILSTPN